MPEEEFRCPRCGSNRFVSVSFDYAITRVPQCVPCGHVHPGYFGRGWRHAGGADSGWTPRREYGLQLPEGRVVVGPGWACEGDVIAASYPHGRRPGGDLVVRDGDGPWRVVRHLDEGSSS